MKFASELRAHRARLGYSQEDFAGIMQIGQPFLSNCERGKARIPRKIVELVHRVASTDQEFREMVLEMAGLTKETPAQAEA